MSRRDTIIVAVLINAGLLIVLFASALKSSSSEQELTIEPRSFVQDSIDVAAKKDAVPVVGDEVDQVLSHYSNATAAAPVVEQTAPAAAPLQSPANNFADDLQVVATPAAPVVAAAPEVEKTAPQITEVKVKKGDVLEKIARHHHCSVDEIMKLNKLTSSNLRIGQVLKIPTKSSLKPHVAHVGAPSPALDSGPKYYTVKNGDNPWTIAVKNHLKVEDLLKLNNMDQEKARRLKPGDQIRIR